MLYSNVQFRLLNAYREVLAIPDPLRFSYTRTANQPSGYSLDLGYDDIDPVTLDAATRVQVYRRPEPGLPLAYEAEYLMRKAVDKRSADGRRVWSLGGSACSVLQLLKSRIINDYKGSARADKSDFVTNIMRAIVTEQCTVTAGAERTFWDTLTVQGDTHQGPYLTKSSERAYVLDTLQALVKAAAEPGPYAADVYFDLAPQGDGFLFYACTGQLGTDGGLNSPAPNVLYADLDFVEWEHERDAEKEVTAVYVGGKGTGAAQTLVTVTDTTRLYNPPGNRWEKWKSVSSESDLGKLAAEGAKDLDEGRPLDRMRGTLVQGLYGKRVKFGDRVVIQQGVHLREVVANSVTVGGDAGRERVDIRLEA